MIDFGEKIRADIERVGWTAISVAPRVGEAGGHFTYTVGLRDLDHPELIVLGLAANRAHGLLAAAFGRIREGARYEDGDRVGGLLVGFDVEFRALPPDGRPLNIARAYYGAAELPALQVVWPDPAGRFPGEEGCEPRYAAVQDIEEARS